MTDKKETLLDRAKKVKTQGRSKLHMSDDLVELVYAWARNEITVGQLSAVLHDSRIIKKTTAQHAYPKIAEVMQHMVMSGLLVPDGWLKNG